MRAKSLITNPIWAAAIVGCSTGGASGSRGDASGPETSGGQAEVASDTGAPIERSFPRAAGWSPSATPSLLEVEVTVGLKTSACGLGSFSLVDDLLRDSDDAIHPTLRWALLPEHEVSRYACVGRARDCAEVSACLGAPCEPGPATCRSSTLVSCDERTFREPRQTELDCGKLGLSCDAEARACVSTTARCDPARSEFQCDAGVGMFCLRKGEGSSNAGPWAAPGTECGRYGWTCSEEAGVCVDTSAAACTVSTCAGSAMRLCTAGKQTTVDCGLIGPGFVCTAAGGEVEGCAPSGAPDCTGHACDGAVAKLCRSGKQVAVNCADYGLSCVMRTWGPECVPGE